MLTPAGCPDGSRWDRRVGGPASLFDHWRFQIHTLSTRWTPASSCKCSACCAAGHHAGAHVPLLVWEMVSWRIMHGG